MALDGLFFGLLVFTSDRACVGVSRCQVAKAFVGAVIIVMVDEGDAVSSPNTP